MNREQFKAICKKSQNELKSYLVTKLKKRYENLWVHKDFVYAQGTVPVLLVAHLDTVHKDLPTVFVEEDDKITSPQGIGGDDRCGVYAILRIIERHNCSVLFCCDEEIGGLGAKAFSDTSLAKQTNINYIIELDRKGRNDAVFYDCDNPLFTDFITIDRYWVENWGSFSDISIIAPKLGVAAVNLSVGYYDQHTLKESVVPSEVDLCIENVCKLIADSDDVAKFEYVEADYGHYSYYGYLKGYKDYRGKALDYEECVYLIQYKDEEGKITYDEVLGLSEYEAIGRFHVQHSSIPHINVLDVINEGYECDLMGY